jgi:hypothetical protein
MTQTRLHSFVESMVNILIGYGVAVTTQIVVFPLFDIHIPMHDNFIMGGVFTIISLIRSYLIRRWFNRGFIFKRPTPIYTP